MHSVPMNTDIWSVNHYSPFLSSLYMDGVGLLGFGAVIAYCLVMRARRLRQARDADTSTQGERTLAAGPTVVSGHVEFAVGKSQAVRIDVDQFGENVGGPGGWGHKWTEKNRRLTVEPFYLRLNPTKRIRVEPTPNVLLIDDLDGFTRPDLYHRTKFAQLSDGEFIHAVGNLVPAQDPEAALDQGGYRGSSASALVLRSSTNEPMLLSSKPLGARFRRHASFYEVAAAAFALLAVCIHVWYAGYHVRRFAGQTIDAPIIELNHVVSRGEEDNLEHHYRVHVNLPTDKPWHDEVNAEVFARLQVGQSIPVRFVKQGFFDTPTIGPHVTVDRSANGIVYVFVAALIAYAFSRRSLKEWYERSVNDEGSGRLESTLAQEQGRAFVPPEDPSTS